VLREKYDYEVDCKYEIGFGIVIDYKLPSVPRYNVYEFNNNF